MSSVYAVTMVKNEEDIIGQVIENLILQGVDGVIVADNMSTDKTRRYLNELNDYYGNLTIVDDNEPGYYQSEKMTALGKLAHEQHGADWIIPFDADEMYYSQYGKLADVLRGEQADVMYGTVWHMVATEEVDDDPINHMVFRWEQPEQFSNVVYRYHPDAVIHMGNHDITHPGERSDISFEVKHYQYRSFEQFAAKMVNGKAAIDATSFGEGVCLHWRQSGAKVEVELREEWSGKKTEYPLVYDPFKYA